MQWTGVAFKVYSCLMLSVPEIGHGAISETGTAEQDKVVIEMNDRTKLSAMIRHSCLSHPKTFIVRF